MGHCGRRPLRRQRLGRRNGQQAGSRGSLLLPRVSTQDPQAPRGRKPASNGSRRGTQPLHQATPSSLSLSPPPTMAANARVSGPARSTTRHSGFHPSPRPPWDLAADRFSRGARLRPLRDCRRGGAERRDLDPQPHLGRLARLGDPLFGAGARERPRESLLGALKALRAPRATFHGPRRPPRPSAAERAEPRGQAGRSRLDRGQPNRLASDAAERASGGPVAEGFPRRPEGFPVQPEDSPPQQEGLPP